MKALIRMTTMWGMILLLLMTVAGKSYSQHVTSLKEVLDGSKNQLTAGAAITVTDSVYFNVSKQSLLDTPYLVRNIITFSINEYSNRYLPGSFTATASLRIIYTRPDFVVDSVDRTLNINYDTTTYAGKSSFVFSNAHNVTVKVLSVSANASKDVLPALLIENEMQVRVTYKLSCAGNVVTSLVAEAPANPDSADEVKVKWNAAEGMDMYDLEWAYIDSTALTDTRYGNLQDANLIFRNNASRVTIAGNSYNIPLIYDNGGVLFFRVRGVQEREGKGRTETAWSSSQSGGLGQFSFSGHQRSLNWQSAISFAEEGKRKVAVEYYDGSLRARQSVTKDNTTQTVIVGESFYDYQGKPVIQVMPSPSLNSVISYSRSFNRALNGSEYDKSNYDSVGSPAELVTASAKPMSAASGANQYYSANNPEKNNGENQYIPDAGGYAFTETSYTPDNTGRIVRQGGVGPVHRLGGNHDTRYTYASPGDNEMDILFGTDAGPVTHYYKDYVQDANGQYSVSYIDMYGRTVATALAGVPDSATLTPLSYNNAINFTDTLSRRTVVKDLVLESTQNQMVVIESDYKFNYLLNAPVLQRKDCDNNTICYNGLYDLEIKITDDAFNQRLGGQPFDTILHNYTPGTYPANCSASQNIQVGFTKRLKPGAYKITKRLTINRDALDYYRDSVFLKENLCVTLEQFIQQQRDILSTQECKPSCESCNEALGPWETFRDNYMNNTGISSADSAAARDLALAAYNEAVANCKALCGTTSESESIRNAMLQDMMPPYGQYANLGDTLTLDTYSIFFQVNDKSLPPYQRDSIVYYDELGRRDSVYNEETGSLVIPQRLSPGQFAAKFKTSWATALLRFHPEYYKLLLFEGYKSTYDWDKKFEDVDSYQAAKTAGYLNPLGSSFVPNFPSGDIDPYAYSLASKVVLEAKMKNYNEAKKDADKRSIWSMATISAKCLSNSTDCFNSYAKTSDAFNEATLCAGDLDMAWRAFRQFYLNAKHAQIDYTINETVSPGYTRVTAKQLFAAGKQPHFSPAKDALEQSGMGSLVNGTDSTIMKDSVNAMMQRSYDENCRSYVSAWIKQLAPCKYSQSGLDTLTKLLIAVCKEGADQDHPYGASTVKPSSTSYYRSFEEVIETFNAEWAISNSTECNGYLITIPAAYDKQPAYGNKQSYTKPSDCECENLRRLNTEYLAYKKSSDFNLAIYLNRTRGTSFTDAHIQRLLSACNSSANDCNYLSGVLEIPALIQCNVAPPCATCEVVNDLYAEYMTRFPGMKPEKEEADSVQRKKNTLFASFMTNKLGFSKDAWEYLAFMDSCQLYGGKDSLVCNSDKQLMHSYSNGTKDVISDVVRTVDNGYIMAGYTTVNNTHTDAYLIKTDANGNLQWSKRYGDASGEVLAKVKTTTDGGYIAIGSVGRYALILKVDRQGELTWSRRIGYDTPGGEVGTDIIQTTDGGYAFTSKYDIRNIRADIMVGAITSSGSVKWLKKVGNSNGDEGSSLLQNNDTLVITACTLENDFDGHIIKIDRNTGNVIKVDRYDIGPNGTGNFSGFILKVPGGYLANYANGSDTAARNSILKINENGSVLSAKQFTRPIDSTVTQWMPIGYAVDGSIVAVQNTLLTSKNNITWHKIKADGTLLSSDMMVMDSTVSMNKIVTTADNSFAGAGNYGNDAFLMFKAFSGQSGCNDLPINVAYQNVSVRPSLAAALDSNLVLNSGGLKSVTLQETVMNPVHKTFNCVADDNCFRMSNGPHLCGYADPVFPSVDANEIDNCSDNEFFAIAKGTELFNAYRDSLKNDFESVYIDTCVNAGLRELFTVNYNTSEYHYTLYYYDRAGNLVRTVPPLGVVITRATDWVAGVRAARANGTTKLPPHRLTTEYRYNTLNKVIAQQAPDNSRMHRSFYDRIGRLAGYQDPAQGGLGRLTYSLYDNLGRVIQKGSTRLFQLTHQMARDTAGFNQWFNGSASTRIEIVKTTYDVPNSLLSGSVLSATNLRNRVSWSALYSTATDLNNNVYTTGTFYSYDRHGNVDTLIQDYRSGAMAAAVGNRFKKMVYRYDLISGKVNHVAYQPGQPDAFYHRYSYDAENRITNVETSRDSIYWDNDAYYKYYKHGPLARTVIGQQQVQGLDYAYTLQGWLKGVNSTAVTADTDMGKDGVTGGLVAKDAFGFALHYYGNRDYSAINNTDPFAKAEPAGTNFKPLYNGNIAAISQNMPVVGTPFLSTYTYDVLNRLLGMRVSQGLNTTTNTWTPVMLPDFKEAISYDPMGNIKTYVRYGNNTFAGMPLLMDSLQYNYPGNSNKLSEIKDFIDSTNYANDIDNQNTLNYDYDLSGRLRKDVKTGITIGWTTRDKIDSILYNTGEEIEFSYDIADNRISKIAGGKETWYVRDASGNVMSVYVKGDNSLNNGDLTQSEAHLYGSSRLGINTLNTNVKTVATPVIVNLPGLGSGFNTNFTRGKKFFELSNHLGNVLATVSDRKEGVSSDSVSIDHFEADIVSAQEYYSFGMQMPGRGFSGNKYRYGFNGKENDNEVKGEGNQQDYGMRVYDPRISKFLSVDPLTKKYPELTPYQFASNSPIQAVDLDGQEIYHYTLLKNDKGNTVLRYDGVQTRYASSFSLRQLNPFHDASNWENYDGDLIKTKSIAVSASEGKWAYSTGDYYKFSSFKELSDWRQAKYPALLTEGQKELRDNPEAVAKRQAVIQLMVNEMYFRGDMADGHFDALLNVKFPKQSEARELLDDAVSRQGLLNVPKRGFKEKWTENGYDYEVRLHTAQGAGAPAGSNSSTVTTFRVGRRIHGVKPGTTKQGWGWEYADDNNNWFSTEYLKNSGDNKAANDTHIPIKKK